MPQLKKCRVSGDEFWVLVGKVLEDVREGAGIPWAEVERLGGPAAPTVRDQERGQCKTIKALREHATALGVTAEDVLCTAMFPASHVPEDGADLRFLIRRFEAASPAGKRALLAVALAVRDDDADVPVRQNGRGAKRTAGR